MLCIEINKLQKNMCPLLCSSHSIIIKTNNNIVIPHTQNVTFSASCCLHGQSLHLDWEASEVKVAQSCPTLCDPMEYRNSPGQNTGMGNLSLLQGIFPTQGSNPSLPHCRRILYQSDTRESPRLGTLLSII